VEFPFQVAPVEPDALQSQPALAHGEFEDGHASRAQERRTADFGDHAGRLAGLQFIQAARVLAVLVAEGQVVKQVLGRLDALAASISATFGPTPRTYITGVSRLATLRMLNGLRARGQRGQGQEPAP